MSRGRDEMEVKSRIYLVLIRRDTMLKCVYNVKTERGFGRGVSDLSVVLLRLRVR